MMRSITGCADRSVTWRRGARRQPRGLACSTRHPLHERRPDVLQVERALREARRRSPSPRLRALREWLRGADSYDARRESQRCERMSCSAPVTRCCLGSLPTSCCDQRRMDDEASCHAAAPCVPRSRCYEGCACCGAVDAVILRQLATVTRFVHAQRTSSHPNAAPSSTCARLPLSASPHAKTRLIFRQTRPPRSACHAHFERQSVVLRVGRLQRRHWHPATDRLSDDERRSWGGE